ncbi:hypothetical protein FQR65_LT20005 [Abscondita terminalis]|nr:hypothetical protein FQR65_LT20005 [Abscondita terminalis]
MLMLISSTYKYDRTDEERMEKKLTRSTSINLKPKNRKKKVTELVKGQYFQKVMQLKNGELALGRNLKVAFMPWKG